MTDKDLLAETHGAVMEIRGHLPHLATRADVRDAIDGHESLHHPPTPPARFNNLRGKLIAAVITLITAAAAAITAVAANS